MNLQILAKEKLLEEFKRKCPQFIAHEVGLTDDYLICSAKIWQLNERIGSGIRLTQDVLNDANVLQLQIDEIFESINSRYWKEIIPFMRKQDGID